MEYLILFLKGFIIGVGKIIPGVSGAVLAISLGLYEKGLNAISNFFSDIKNNLKFLIPIGLGVLIAIVLASKLVVYFLQNYYLSTMLLFIGLIIGGLPYMVKKLDFNSLNYKNYIYFIISFLSIILLQLIGQQNFFVEYSGAFTKFLVFAFIGFLNAVTMVIPGISGTAIMMILGCYYLLMNTLGSLTSLNGIIANIGAVVPFIFGVALGIILLSKLMNYLLKNKTQSTYTVVVGFAISSVLTLIFKLFETDIYPIELLFGSLLLVIGIMISYKMNS